MEAFNSIFGGGKKKMPKSGGHVLGGTTESLSGPPPPPRVLDITFCNNSLGMHLTKLKDGSVAVKKVETNSEASRAGVRVGFRVAKLQGNAVNTYERLIEDIQSCGRPCSITFEDNTPVSAPIPQKKSTGLSAEENAARREASVKAAESRTAAWDKKMTNTRVAKAQSAKLESQKSLERQPEEVSHASSVAFEAAKRKEAAESERLGFNPYQPIFGSASQGRAAVEAVASGDIEPTMGYSSPKSASSSSHRNPPRPEIAATTSQATPEERKYEPSEELSEALALIASHPEEVSQAAISTCYKLMTNLCANFSEEKYHRVRMENKAFNKKVATVSGGIELMNAAGFVFLSDESTDDMLLVYPMTEQPKDDLRCAVQHLKYLLK